MAEKVAVVTGANKGIGLSIVQELLKRGVEYVYLTARDVNRGKEAVNKLQKEGLNPTFYQLEVTDEASVKKFADYLKSKHGGIDILVNNAGVITSHYYETSFEDSQRVIDVNYKSILIIQHFIFPVLKDNARVINISSDCGHISNIKNKLWIKRLTKEYIKQEDTDAFVEWFLDSVKNNTLKEEDFAEMSLLAYRISKVALCALTRAQQRIIGRNISINSLHPGFVKTEMTQGVGFMTVEESAKAPAYLALDLDQSVKGKYFWFDKTEKDWSDPALELYCKFENMQKLLNYS